LPSTLRSHSTSPQTHHQQRPNLQPSEMPLHTKLPDHLDKVDLIIAGGGSAGCIVAGRLAAADRNLHILLVEGGRNNYNDPNVIHAALGPLNLAPEKMMAIFYKTVKEEQLAGREMVVPSGGILGGGSSINAALWVYSWICAPSWE
jgi:alcohol oxidase